MSWGIVRSSSDSLCDSALFECPYSIRGTQTMLYHATSIPSDFVFTNHQMGLQDTKHSRQQHQTELKDKINYSENYIQCSLSGFFPQKISKVSSDFSPKIERDRENSEIQNI